MMTTQHDDLDDISFYVCEEEDVIDTSDISDDNESLDDKTESARVIVDGDCEDCFDDISFYIGDKHDGFCSCTSLGESEISMSDSEYDCDDDDDWSFDCACLDDSEDASGSVNIGEEVLFSAFSPSECLPSPSKNVSTTTLWQGDSAFSPSECLPSPNKNVSTTTLWRGNSAFSPKESSPTPTQNVSTTTLFRGNSAFSPRESFPSRTQNVSTATLFRGKSMPPRTISTAPSTDPFQLFRPKTISPDGTVPDMAPVSNYSLASITESTSKANEEWFHPVPTKAPTALLRRASLTNKPSPPAPADEKNIDEFCTTAAKVGGAALLLSLWGSTFVTHTKADTGKKERVANSKSQPLIRC